ncbi:MAG: hypothetical protein LBJ63_02775 [Prevotellaceae bacterium]|jgi:hypothetical protein|nr:hypothetical protein [Prevotellaceae bacterium]
MKKFKLILLIFCLNSILNAQTTPPEIKLPALIPPSPQTAQFNRYGEIPVGHTTGVPQIEIPIYTLSTGWIDIPISLSYHASGFRPHDIPSPVGLGWVLNAGGVISRSVEVKGDFEDYDEMPIKSAAQVDSLKNGTKLYNYAGNNWMDFSKYPQWERWYQYFMHKYNTNSPEFDTRSDRYYYNFLGKTGTARYNVDTKELTAIPYDPIKIEKVANNSYLITDTKGIKYEFSETEYGFYQGIGNYASGWYLTKITCPGKESEPIVFSYKQGIAYNWSRINSITTIYETTNYYPAGGEQPNSTWNVPRPGDYTNASGTSISFQSLLIEKITWKNNTVSFDYRSDRKDKRKERLSTVTVKHNNSIIQQTALDNDDYFGNSSDKFRLKLKGINTKGNNTNSNGETYTFDYYNEYSQMPSYDAYCSEDYWGYYNGISSYYSFPNDIDINTASGGIYNYLISTNRMGTVNHIYRDRKPYEDYTKYTILSNIVYPTGGKTHFDYEINKVPNAYNFYNGNNNINSNNKVGGLRLKQKINYSDANTITDIKTYKYDGYATQILSNDLFVYRIHFIFGWVWSCWIPGSTGEISAAEYYGYMLQGESSSSITGWSGSNVFYNTIKEYKGTETDNEGWTEYIYEEENRLINNECLWNIDEHQPYLLNKTSDCDKGNLKSLLLKTVLYDKNGIIKKNIENTYQHVEIPSISTGVRVIQMANYPYNRFEGYYICEPTDYIRQTGYQNFYLDQIHAINTYAYRDISLLGQTTETEYENGEPTVNKTISYAYDVKDGKPVTFTPSQITQTNSKNEVYTKRTIFPYHDNYKNTPPYNTMISKNMLDYPIEEKIEKDSSDFVSHIKTGYEQVAGSSMILPKTIFAKQTAGGSLEPRIVYQKYDSRGNPLYLTKDDATKVVYIWGYNYQYPIAEIKNVTYDEVKTALNYSSDSQIETLAAKAEPTSSDWNLINNLRIKLPDAQVAVHKYLPLVGRLSATGPSGNTVYYEYDELNRLKFIKDHDNNILQRYDYNYKQ